MRRSSLCSRRSRYSCSCTSCSRRSCPTPPTRQHPDTRISGRRRICEAKALAFTATSEYRVHVLFENEREPPLAALTFVRFEISRLPAACREPAYDAAGAARICRIGGTSYDRLGRFTPQDQSESAQR